MPARHSAAKPTVWAVLDRERFIDLTEIFGPIDSEPLGAEADGQFLEIGLGDFGIFRREALMHQIVPFLADGIVVEHENGERQVMADSGVEIGDVHHERSVRRDMSDSFAGPRKASPKRYAQALSNRAEIRSERPIVGAGAGERLHGHHQRVTAVEYENAIALR